MLPLAKTLLILGLILLLAGGLLFAAAKLNLPLGRLPGDIRISRGNVACFFPIVTGILLSVILTVALNVIVRFLNK